MLVIYFFIIISFRNLAFLKGTLFMKAKKYKHLSFEDRCTIEDFLNNNYNFTKIANRIGKDRTTVAHEIKKHRFLRSTNNGIINLVVSNLNHLMFAMAVRSLTLVEKTDFITLMLLLKMNIILL